MSEQQKVNDIINASNDELLEMVLSHLLTAKMAAMQLYENTATSDGWYLHHTLVSAISTAQNVANMVE